jgi:two-component system sensor histidine kinase and response regulator WspE
MIELDQSMYDLFREEVRVHADTLSRGLVELESDPGSSLRIEPLMRAAHSIKGAARIVGVDGGVRLAHVMEDALVAAQHGEILLTASHIDLLLQGSDILATLAKLTLETTAAWGASHHDAIERLVPAIQVIVGGTAPAPTPASPQKAEPVNGQTVAQPSRVPAAETVAPTGAVAGDFPPCQASPPPSIPPTPLTLPDGYSMVDVFREELRSNLLIVSRGLEGELDPVLEAIKQVRGAARIMKCASVERLASALGRFLGFVREKRASLTPLAQDWCRAAIAALAGAISVVDGDDSFAAWAEASGPRLIEIAEVFERVQPATPAPAAPGPTPKSSAPSPPPRPLPLAEPPSPIALIATSAPAKAEPLPAPTTAAPAGEGVVRVTAQSLNRLMGLAGESLVQARWLPSFSTALLALKKHHDLLATLVDRLFHAISEGASADELTTLIADARRQAALCRADLSDKSADFDDHAARAEDLNARLYREVIVSRMRPFGDGIHGLSRLVRDMARSLGKEAKLIVDGERTEVDRDILEKLESPLSHLVRNAIDHGLETPEVRLRAGKPPTGVIRLEARHRAGMLHLAISDDGAGIDLDRLRRKIVDRGLNSADVVRQMTEAELLEFLFLPGFSTASTVTEFSGRGVGLDVVHDTLRKVGGSVRITTNPGRGAAFLLQLPLTLSVMRAVVVDVSGEPYAFPHTRIDRLIQIRRRDVRSLEHRQFAVVDGQNVGLVVTAQLLDLPPGPPVGEELAVVLLSDSTGTYGLVVDSFRGEQDLVVRPLDPRLGKIPNLSAAAILDDGSPVLIVDVEDLIRSTDQFIQTGALKRCETKASGPTRKKRVLVVDDSITVREVERQLLLHRGYDVSIAVDGMEGWNKVRSEKFDLLVSDIDMPRMSGLQLVSAVRNDEKLRNMPVVIVSYKEREEDRLKGLEVGANCYLTKSSFHDNRFIEAVEGLIGTA